MTEQAVTVQKAVNPFKGPKPLEFNDPIFGRDSEIHALQRQLISDRVVLLHSTSGCGKSSLVEAGLRKHLPKEFSQIPTTRLKKLLDNPALRGAGFIKAALEEVESKVEEGFRFAFFDQFEEVLTAQEITAEDRLAFFKRLGLALDNRRLWVILAVRDDYVGGLQTYLRLLPTRLASRFRLGPLPAKSAEEAMRNICEGSVVTFAPRAAAKLTERLSYEESKGTRLVEPVHLQVVCRYLWDRAKESHRIEADALSGMGFDSVNDALGEYYAHCVSRVSNGDADVERDLRDWFGDKLIDRQQRARARVNPDQKLLLGQVDRLEDHYLIRKDQVQDSKAGVIVELAHDRLVSPVISNNEVWMKGNFGQEWMARAAAFEKNPSPELLVEGEELKRGLEWCKKKKIRDREEKYLQACLQEQKKRRTLRWLIAGCLICGLLAGLSTAWAMTKISESRTAIAKADVYTQQASAQLEKARNQLVDAQSKIGTAAAAQAAAMAKEADAVSQASRALAAARRSEKDRDDAIAAATTEKETSARISENAKAELKAALVTKSAAEQNAAKLEKENKKFLIMVADEKKASDRRKRGIDALRSASTARDKADITDIVKALEFIGSGEEMEKNVVTTVFKTAEDIFSRELLVKTLAEKQFITALGVVNSEARIVTADAHYACVTIETGGRCTALEFERNNATAAALGGPHGRPVVGDSSGVLHIPAMKDRPALKFRASRHQIVSVALSSSGNYVASSAALWSIGVWRLSGPKVDRILSRPGVSPFGIFEWLGIFMGAQNHLVNAVALHEFAKDEPKGWTGLAATARQDNRVQVWPMHSGVFRRNPVFDSKTDDKQTDLSSPAIAVAFSPNGNILGSGARDGSIYLWDFSGDSRKLGGPSQRKLALAKACTGSADVIAFSPAGSDLMAAGCQDGKILLYDVHDLQQNKWSGELKPKYVLDGRLADVRFLTFDPDRRQLLSAGAKPGIEVWRIPTVAGFDGRTRLKNELPKRRAEAEAMTTDTKATSPSVHVKNDLEKLMVEHPETLPWDGYRARQAARQ